MVSSPRFRSPGTRSASAIVPVLENSSVAYHKEICTVLFDPPSFLMVYSIVCHLWKKSKMKKFLPLPPLHKSLQAPFVIQEPLLDSASEEEGESSPRVSSVPESVTTNHHCNFSFGNFHSEIVQIKSIKSVKQDQRLQNRPYDHVFDASREGSREILLCFGPGSFSLLAT
ncbi:hypothetical protein QL285_002839 [Trifolium repens]|jgi:hypothetical protein|nr:hypothetical protein QL285_002839 [Trifolium repens]